jgi:integrase
MPRAQNLTWQPGAGNRQGRWRKKYKGKNYYFDGGRGKSDRDAYGAAVAAWEQEKVGIDATAPRQFQLEHEALIAEWEQVVAWSTRYGEREMATTAHEKVEALRKRLTTPVLSRVPDEDTLDGQLDPIVRIDLSQIVSNPPDWTKETFALATPLKLNRKKLAEIGLSIDGSDRRIQQEIWQDRLAVQARGAAATADSLEGYVKQFLAQGQRKVDASKVSASHRYSQGIHLQHFSDLTGKLTAVRELDGKALLRYHDALLDLIGKGELSSVNAHHYMATVKQFVRWLWQIEAIPTLPRVLDVKCKQLVITKPAPRIVVFDKTEIKALLAAATPRTKLYMLLMLNCGMTQKDVADLLHEEINWQEGRVVRRRSKTSDCPNVPVVDYLLWPETLRLLKQERTSDSQGRVLLNSNGSVLWEEKFADGKYAKIDNVKSAFDRLRKLQKISKPLKALKKTSASLLRDHAQFTGLRGLFLGHAPGNISDKHYAQIPQNLLDQAITWLGSEYGL